MDRQTIQRLQAECLEALKGIAAKHKLEVKSERGVFDSTTAFVKFQFSEVAENGLAQTREAEDFKFLARRFGFEPEDLGRTFVRNGERFQIVGLAAKAPRFPVQAKSLQTGQVLRFTTVVKQLLEEVTAK